MDSTHFLFCRFGPLHRTNKTSRVMGIIAQKQRYLEVEIKKLRKDLEMVSHVHDVDFDKVYLSKSAAARVIGISTRTLDRWYINGYARRTVIGGRVYYSKREILRIAQLYNHGIGELADAYEVSPFAPFAQQLDAHLQVAQPQ